MIINSKRILKVILVLIVSITICMGAFIAGAYTYSYIVTKQENRQSKASLIAIVNLDDGVMYDGQYVNYASELVELTNPDYVMVGLTEAKEGIVSGTYAAYIVIPETLSKTVTSFEQVPDMIEAEVVYADNLSEEAYRQALLDVREFELNLSTNISYMYIDSMMNELHVAQDGTGQVMDNDDMELNLLTSVDADSLIAEYKEPKSEYPELSIKDTDYSKYTEKNSEIMNSMYEAESKAIEDCNADFNKIQTKGTEVEDNVDKMDETISEAIRIVKESEDEKLDEGFIKMTEDIAGHNRTILERGYPAIIAAFAEEIAEEQIEEDRRVIKSAIEATALPPGVTIDIDSIVLGVKSTHEEIEDRAKNTISWENDTDKLDKLIQDNLTEPLGTLIEEENKSVDEAIEVCTSSAANYTSELLAFDPMEYIEEANLEEYISEVETNTYEYYSDIQESNADYAEYAADIMEATSNQLTSVRETVKSANDETADNVRDSIRYLADRRVETNTENIETLGNFTRMLPYTRIGSKENPQTYEVLANAASVEDVTPVRKSVSNRTWDILDEMSLQDVLTLFLTIGTAICILAFVYMSKRDKAEYI